MMMLRGTRLSLRVWARGRATGWWKRDAASESGNDGVWDGAEVGEEFEEEFEELKSGLNEDDLKYLEASRQNRA